MLFKWEYIGFTGGRYNALIQTPISILIAMFVPGILYFSAGIKVGDIGFWFCLTVFCIIFLMSRYLFLSDLRFEFHVTQYGIHYTKIEDIPDIAYKIVRGIAWLGIPLCIFAGLMYGPLIFAGAGGFALMSFLFTNFHPQAQNHHVFSQSIIIFNPIGDTRFTIKSKDNRHQLFLRDLHSQSIEQKNHIISEFCNSMLDVEVVDINRVNDQYQHPIYEKHRETMDKEDEMNQS
ncbi:hypothetical protein JCM19237_1189 [Photobacterium aphoticum]|uniref:Uncharacterized protein n=1 Tax=Photobacterium aphoticum TaxID=754436 RepID=A0A090RAD1_9GAMM|nr:hypothetical protein JCM19237_1189 [Photobacterium aphoticum]